MTQFLTNDFQSPLFNNNTSDTVINECAVGIPDDSQKVLDEMIWKIRNDHDIKYRFLQCQ